MSPPLPDGSHLRFHQHIAEGLSGRAATARLTLSPTTGSRWARAIRTGGCAQPARQGRPSGNGKLAPYQVFFEEFVAQNPDSTLFELRDTLAAAEGVAAPLGHAKGRVRERRMNANERDTF